MSFDSATYSSDPSNSDIGPVRRLSYNPANGTHEARTPSAKFIKGPIPLNWISRANTLPGKAGAVGMALWFLVGIYKTHTIKLTAEIERIAGCKRKAIYTALAALQRAELITFTTSPGSRPTVTVVCSQYRI